jgi:hypothetical protein
VVGARRRENPKGADEWLELVNRSEVVVDQAELERLNGVANV